ncbi:unnamed protein product, partial [Ectocarpus fasciculatus]
RVAKKGASLLRPSHKLAHSDDSATKANNEDGLRGDLLEAVGDGRKILEKSGEGGGGESVAF